MAAEEKEETGSEDGGSASPPPAAGVVITRLAELPERTMLDEKALAAALSVTPRTVRRMVGRYELPPGFPFAGRTQWFVGRVLAWIEAQAERKQQEAERAAAKFRKFA